MGKWSRTGHFSKTTAWIWSLHADAHDFDIQTNSLEGISQKIFSPQNVSYRTFCKLPINMLLETDSTSVSVLPVEVPIKKDSVEQLVEVFDYGIVGLEAIRDFVVQLSTLLLVNKARTKGAKDASRSIGLHMSFTGASGTGKTFVAHRMAEILRRMGFLRTSAIISVGRDDLVGQFIGHTAPKTRAVLKNAMGGILFIDHADTIYRPNSPRDYGSEAIEILLQVMENSRDDLIVIMAGFTKPMESFFSANPGLSSRITHHLKFNNYTSNELLKLLKIAAKNRNIELTEAATEIMGNNFDSLIMSPGPVELRKDALKSTMIFSNARSVASILNLSQLIVGRKLLESNDVITISDLIGVDGDDVPVAHFFFNKKKAIFTAWLLTLLLQIVFLSLIRFPWPTRSLGALYIILARKNDINININPKEVPTFCLEYLNSIRMGVTHWYTYFKNTEDSLDIVKAALKKEKAIVKTELKKWAAEYATKWGDEIRPS